jgi:hypothetical protein
MARPWILSLRSSLETTLLALPVRRRLWILSMPARFRIRRRPEQGRSPTRSLK